MPLIDEAFAFRFRDSLA